MISPELKSRIPIAIVYVLAVVSSLLYAGIFPIVLFSYFFGMSFYEYYSINSVEGSQRTAVLVSLLFFSAFIFIIYVQNDIVFKVFLVLAATAWLINSIMILVKARTLFLGNRLLIDSFVYLFIPFSLVSMWLLRYPEKSLIMLGVFVVIWLNDTGAYFVGKAFGRHKLAKEISPSKTWEGFFGGLVFGILTCYLLMKLGNIESYFQGFLLAIFVIVASVIGDLTESSWKRYRGIKDSGNLLQGHGGFLDRLDSLIYSVPIVLILYELHIITI